MRAFFNEEPKCIKQGALKAKKGKKKTKEVNSWLFCSFFFIVLTTRFFLFEYY